MVFLLSVLSLIFVSLHAMHGNVFTIDINYLVTQYFLLLNFKFVI